MKAGRWWRDYDQECAEWSAVQPGRDPGLVRCVTDDGGIELRLRCWFTRPVAHGVFRIE